MNCQILAGLDWSRMQADRLIVFFPSGALSITGIELASASQAILNESSRGVSSKENLLERAAAAACARGVICRYAYDLLLRARALVEYDFSEALSEVECIHYYIHGNTLRFKKLREFSLLCFCVDEDVGAVKTAFELVGLNVTVRGPTPNSLEEAMKVGKGHLLVSIGFAPHDTFSRRLNQVAVATDSTVLFASCSGLVARIGPTVIGRNLPCLDCVSTRHAANGGGEMILTDFDDCTDSGTESLMRPLSPPALRQLMVMHAALESERILQRDAPVSFGGYLELSYSGHAVRREVLKAPHCVSCSAHSPERYPFDVTPFT